MALPYELRNIGPSGTDRRLISSSDMGTILSRYRGLGIEVPMTFMSEYMPTFTGFTEDGQPKYNGRALRNGEFIDDMGNVVNLERLEKEFQVARQIETDKWFGNSSRKVNIKLIELLH